MPVVVMIEVLEFFPETAGDRFATAELHIPALLRLWTDNDLGHADTLHVLICRPAELSRGAAHAAHLEDQAQAMESAAGRGTAVQLMLTDEDVTRDQDFVALRWRAAGTGSQGKYFPGIEL